MSRIWRGKTSQANAIQHTDLVRRIKYTTPVYSRQIAEDFTQRRYARQANGEGNL
jgi:hypothetical protein